MSFCFVFLKLDVSYCTRMWATFLNTPVFQHNYTNRSTTPYFPLLQPDEYDKTARHVTAALGLAVLFKYVAAVRYGMDLV
jgi:hypothetical protein